MKNLFKKTLLFAAAAFTFASCSNDTTEDVVLAPAVKVSLTATLDDTRSEFGDYNSTDNTYPTLWSGDENWFIAINDKYTESIADITFSDDHKTANATLEFDADKTPTADSNGEYTLYALSPASAWSSYNLANDYLRFYIARNTQTPTTTSCDPASQVLFAKSEPMENTNSFGVNFAHLSAYVKFSFLNVAEGGVVSSVTISAEDVNLAGRYAYTPSTGALTEYDRLEKSITLVTDKTEDLWLAIAPVDVSGKVLTFSITTDKGILSKEVTMPATAKFESGKVVTFTVNMADIEYPSADEGETWQLITNVADITDGEYIIVAKNSNNNIVYLPSTTTTSAPTQTAITVPGLDLSRTEAFTTTLIPTNARFTFSGGTSKMTVTNADGKYLYTTNSNNGLRINNTRDTWTIEAHSKTSNSLTMKSASQSRYVTLYAAQDWRCYTSERGDYESDQNGVTFLYKKVEAVDPTAPTLSLDKSSLEFETAGGSQTVTATTTNYTGDITAESDNAHFTTSVEGNVVTVTAPANEEASVKTATITITAGTLSKTVTVSQAAQLAGTGEGTEASPYDVTRALAAIDANTGISGVYVKGIVTETAMTFNSNYNSLNYYISEDGTTASQLYVYSGKNLNNTNFTEDYANELHVGDEVVVYGDLTLYGTTYEFNYNNYIVSLTCNNGEGGGNETPDPEEPETPSTGEEVTATINFGDVWSGQTNLEVSNTYVLKDGVLNLTFKEKNNSSTSQYTGAQLRLYKDDVFTFSSSKNLKSVVFTCSGTNYAKEGTVSTGTHSTSSGVVTWTAENATTTSFDVTLSGSAWRITGITVTYYN